MQWTQTLLAGMQLKTPGPDAKAIAEAEDDLNHPLPKELLELYKEFDGGTGRLGTREFALWSLEKLVDENIAAEVTANTPGLILIGTDTGTEAYGCLKKRYPSKPWGRISLMAAGGDEFEPLAVTLVDLLDAIRNGR